MIFLGSLRKMRTVDLISLSEKAETLSVEAIPFLILELQKRSEPRCVERLSNYLATQEHLLPKEESIKEEKTRVEEKTLEQVPLKKTPKKDKVIVERIIEPLKEDKPTLDQLRKNAILLEAKAEKDKNEKIAAILHGLIAYGKIEEAIQAVEVVEERPVKEVKVAYTTTFGSDEIKKESNYQEKKYTEEKVIQSESTDLDDLLSTLQENKQTDTKETTTKTVDTAQSKFTQLSATNREQASQNNATKKRSAPRERKGE